MNNHEFATFARRLFTQFPGLYDWLGKNSPDPKATQEIWRETLRPFALDECLGVLADWQAGFKTPFAAYERDQVALIVRSVIVNQRGKAAARQEQIAMLQATRAARAVQPKRHKLDDGNRIAASSTLDGCMMAAVERLRPEYQRMLNGEISREQYDSLLEGVVV